MTVKIMEVVMPQLGVNDVTVSLVQWLQEEGEYIKLGQTLAMVETSKASFELECEGDGYFYPLFSEGSTVSIQAVVALILSEQDMKAAQKYKQEIVAKQKQEKPLDTTGTLTAEARKLVEKYKIDISLLPQGRIIREKDIRVLLKSKPVDTAELSTKNTPQRIVVYGASEGGDCVVDLLHAIAGYEVIAFLEDNTKLVGGTRNGLPIWSGNDLSDLTKEGIGAVTTHIADPKFRLALLQRAEEAGMVMVNAIHP
ncbi:MAG: hypothetical protein KAH38_11840, partial [Candidatus Hydrogenedentes bacterium]|nr:hypothetical protein [Candidatus Hydrogenedentota bacterium]